MAEQFPTTRKRTVKNHDQQKEASTLKDLSSRKHRRKGESPNRVAPATTLPADFKTFTCRNSACKAILSMNDTFCKRCSCCICHLFDENKDPSLWLECTTESGKGDSCGSTCHIECALKDAKAGVVDLGQLMQLDGSYCCATCGKVSGLIGCWKKQLSIAKDARRVDVLCCRIFLSYRLLEGTDKFKELHEITKEVKAKLETEVGPLNGISSEMVRGIVGRLSIAGDVQTLCSLAIKKADELLSAKPCGTNNIGACRFTFEEITSSSIVIAFREVSALSNYNIKGYKLWYSKSRDEAYTKEPVRIFPRSQRKIMLSNLHPCTEYSVRIVLFTEAGDLGHNEAKCFTKPAEILPKSSEYLATNNVRENTRVRGTCIVQEEPKAVAFPEPNSGFKVPDQGLVSRTEALAQSEGGCEARKEKCFEDGKSFTLETTRGLCMPSVTDQLDLNVSSMPDLNEEFILPIESSKDEDNEGNLGFNSKSDDDALSSDTKKNDDLQKLKDGKSGDVQAADSQVEFCKKRPPSIMVETHDSASTQVNASPVRTCSDSGCLDGNFEDCVKVIRRLECDGYIVKEFRMKLLTWFSLRSTEQERRVVNTFIQTLNDDPSCLAGQLIDSFSDIISSKRHENGFCNKLWH